MGLFLATQLDFIFFFYGLAFMLLGAVCFSIARGAVGKAARFDLLGWFGLVHGGSEWLDLTALIIDDGPAFQAFRTTVMSASYLFPLEFARLAAIRLGAPMPGRWIYVPLLMAVVATGIVNGQVSANILARYLLGAPGAFGTCVVMIIRARTLEILRDRWCCALQPALHYMDLPRASLFRPEISGLPTRLSRTGL